MNAPSLRAWLSRPVDYRRSFFRNMSRLAIFLFGVEVATGALLSLYYRPSPEAAYESVGMIMSTVTLGWLVRGLHVVTGHALAVVIGLYVVRAFFLRTFLKPNGNYGWVLAVGFSILTLAFLMTGMSLPWDQASYWRTQLTANLVQQVPLVGTWAADFFRGGPEVSGVTLVRLFALHALLFPWVGFAAIIAARRLRQRGGIR